MDAGFTHQVKDVVDRVENKQELVKTSLDFEYQKQKAQYSLDTMRYDKSRQLEQIKEAFKANNDVMTAKEVQQKALQHEYNKLKEEAQE